MSYVGYHQPEESIMDSSLGYSSNFQAQTLAGIVGTENNVSTGYGGGVWRRVLISLLVMLLVIFIIYLFVLTIISDDLHFPLGRFILAIPPQAWAALGIAIAFTFSVAGAGW
jgi:hypothetical protein